MNLKQKWEMHKLNRQLNGKGGCKQYLPVFIVFFILFTAFFAYDAIQFVKILNSNDDVFIDININDYITTPYTNDDFNSAKNKLKAVGLENLGNQYIITNLENNADIPNADLTLTGAEFESLLIPIYYAKYGKVITIHEMSISQNDDETYLIKTIYQYRLSINAFTIKINHILYIEEDYLLDSSKNEIGLHNFKILNIKEEYKSQDEIKDANKSKGYLEEYYNYVFIKGENKTYIEQLNYNIFEIQGSEITLSKNTTPP